jgi:hypothetical protein
MQTSDAAPQQAIEQPRSRGVDVALWVGILLPLHAAGLNTIVGYIVAHHTCNANRKTSLVVVSVVDLVLAIGGGVMAAGLRSRFQNAEDEEPHDGRRLFMANLGLMIAGLCALLILGGLIATLTLSPCD